MGIRGAASGVVVAGFLDSQWAFFCYEKSGWSASNYLTDIACFLVFLWICSQNMYSRLSKLTHPLKTLLIKMFIISIVVFLWNNFEISCLTLSVLCALRSVLGSRIWT